MIDISFVNVMYVFWMPVCLKNCTRFSDIAASVCQVNFNETDLNSNRSFQNDKYRYCRGFKEFLHDMG